VAAKKLRKLLYMPIGRRSDPAQSGAQGLTTRQLLAKGKKAKVAFIACMRKLISILNAMLARGEKMGFHQTCNRLTSPSALRADRLNADQPGDRTGSRPKPPKAGGAQRQALSLADHRATSHSTVAPSAYEADTFPALLGREDERQLEQESLDAVLRPSLRGPWARA